MAEDQEQAKPKEREIPVFRVLKNNCILKNIFVLDNPPPIPSSSSALGAEIFGEESEREEILLVGRHPDCHVKLEHPSISRFHLRIHSKSSSRSLFVTDLSSVHGTCISGKRIEPGVMMELVPGDTLKLGESSRLYSLDWVPVSFAYDVNNPFVPQLDSLDTIDEETEGATNEDENRSSLENDWGRELSDQIEALGWESSEEDLGLAMTAKEENSLSPELFNDENEITGGQQLLTADEEAEEVMDQERDSLLHRNDEDEIYNDENEIYSSQLCQIQKENTPQLEDEVESITSPKICINENELLSSQLCQIEKENATPQGRIPLAETTEAFEMNSEKRRMNIWSRRGKSEVVKIKTSRTKAATCTRIHMSARVKSLLVENCVNESMPENQCASPDKDEEIFTPNKENASPDSCLVRSLGSKFDKALKSESVSVVDEDEEAFASDKENMTPNSHLLRSIKNLGSSVEVRRPNLHKPSPLKAASRSISPEELILQEVNQQRGILQERKPVSSASRSHCSSKKQPYGLKAAEREPFLPLPLVSSSDNKRAPMPSIHEYTLQESRSIEYCKVSGNRWIIVVDTSCLLNKKSRRELQLLRGLRGTFLVIPRIVLKELDCMVRRASFLSRMTEASAALQWIEESMASSTWWIHVQSSAEESRLVPPTPPASSAPLFREEKGAFPVGSIPFSPYTLQEIVTPTAADHILESALFFKQTMNGQLVLLSDDVTLKIKAMAKGVLCETAKEFRASLVNPFSTRFLYSASSPRGPTWTCVDDTVLKEKYYPSPTKKATRSVEGAKGLKLILLHNSNFRQMKA